MLPTEKGRICLGCGKLITDFREYSWKDIVKVHTNSPTPVCGIYSDKQLRLWGREESFLIYSYAKFIKIPATLLALHMMVPIFSQAQKKPQQEQFSVRRQDLNPLKQVNTVFSGVVSELQDDYSTSPLKGVTILVYPYIFLTATTDLLGRFAIDITSEINNLPNPIEFVVSCNGFERRVFKLQKDEIGTHNITLDRKLTTFTMEVYIDVMPGRTLSTHFYAQAPKEILQSGKKRWWQLWRKK